MITQPIHFEDFTLTLPDEWGPHLYINPDLKIVLIRIEIMTSQKTDEVVVLERVAPDNYNVVTVESHPGQWLKLDFNARR